MRLPWAKGIVSILLPNAARYNASPVGEFFFCFIHFTTPPPSEMREIHETNEIHEMKEMNSSFLFLHDKRRM